MDVRVLTDRAGGHVADRDDVTDEDLRSLYRPPAGPWLRANMVTTVDGAATGASGRSGSINNATDKRVFDTLRSLADAVVVGAGTARTEGYGPAGVPVVLVSRRGQVPDRLRDAPEGSVLMVTVEDAPSLAATRRTLGRDNVVVAGHGSVDLRLAREQLTGRGLRSLLCEGGPQLLAAALAQDVVDELCLTVVPRLLAGEHPRVTSGPDVDRVLELTLLLEEHGTLLSRWRVAR